MRGARRKKKQEAAGSETQPELPPSRPLRKRDLVLAIVLSDSTFEQATGAGGASGAWTGKCIHCGSRLVVSAEGEPISRATIEHIYPKCHGGGDELSNVALACARCNSLKGVHHDTRHRDDPELGRIVEALREKRRARWREPAS